MPKGMYGRVKYFREYQIKQFKSLIAKLHNLTWVIRSTTISGRASFYLTSLFTLPSKTILTGNMWLSVMRNSNGAVPKVWLHNSQWSPNLWSPQPTCIDPPCTPSTCQQPRQENLNIIDILRDTQLKLFPKFGCFTPNFNTFMRATTYS